MDRLGTAPPARPVQGTSCNVCRRWTARLADLDDLDELDDDAANAAIEDAMDRGEQPQPISGWTGCCGG